MARQQYMRNMGFIFLGGYAGEQAERQAVKEMENSVSKLKRKQLKTHTA